MSWFSKTFKKVTRAVKKVVSGVGTILGMGGGSSAPAVQAVQEVKSEPPVVSVTDVSADTKKSDSIRAEAKKKRRKGFMSTQKNTILGSTDNSDTLG